VHFVADAHQPLHASADDRAGMTRSSGSMAAKPTCTGSGMGT
jgi:hypothetical protein